MNIKTTFLYILLSLAISSMVANANVGVTEIKKWLIKHPFSSAFTGVGSVLPTFYGVCYGINWLITRNKQIHSILKIYSIADENKNNDEITLFVHGIAETGKQATWYNKPSTCLIKNTLATYNAPDATENFWRVNFTQTALGQEYEIKALESAYQNLIEKFPNKKITLIGVSRGAAAIFNWIAQSNPKNINAVILESPFDSTATIIQNILKKGHLHYVPGMKMFGNYLMAALFWQYSPHGIQPIDNINKIDRSIPILFVCSKEDTLIPAESTKALYQALKDAGHKKVQLFVANSGKHARILHGKDGSKYVDAVNAFYQKYNLPHDKQLAQAAPYI